MGDLASVKGRKWQITINNPAEHGFSHDAIKEILSDVKGLVYWCMCDETGDECETLHTHLYLYFKHARTAEWVNKRFPNMHRELTNGTSEENRAYILKDGEKFNKKPDGSYHYIDSRGKTHDGVNHSDTFEESGECPVDRRGKGKDADLIVDLIRVY